MATPLDLLTIGRQFEQFGDFVQAEQTYRAAIQMEPANADCLFRLGMVLTKTGRLTEAVASHRKAIEANPRHDEAHNNLGIALVTLGRLDEAVPAFRQAIQLRPDLVYLHSNLGNTLRQLGQLDEAVASLQTAVRIDPAYAAARSNLGIALEVQGKLTEAAACYRALIELNPHHAMAHARLGLTLARLGRFDEAMNQVRQSLAINPSDANYAEVQNNLGVVYYEQQKLDEAVACYERALQRVPDYPDARRNRGLVWLLQGKWQAGWQEFEWRWRCKDSPAPAFRQPMWDGSDLTGRTILLHAEQGMGDMLQFIRYAPLVKQRGGRVIVEAPAALISILRSCRGIDELVAEGEPLPEFDVYAPLMSLARIFGTLPSSTPGETRYLTADPDRVLRWKDALPSGDVFKIGIVWFGNAKFPRNRDRSVPLALFRAVGQARRSAAYQSSERARLRPVDRCGRPFCRGRPG